MKKKKLQKQPKKRRLQRQESCPCGSDKTTEQCCAVETIFGTRLRKKIPTLLPPPPVSNHEHWRCYLAGTKNCCPTISREHFISDSVLRLIGDVVAVSNLHWLEEGETRELTIGALGSNILCRRHNASLSPLDDEALLFFSCFENIIDAAAEKSLKRKHKRYLFSGEVIEKWFLKVAAGMFYSNTAAIEGMPLAGSGSIDMQLITNALYKDEWSSPHCGLYIKGLLHEVTTNDGGISARPFLRGDKMVGVACSFRRLEMMVMFDPIGIDKDELNAEGWRFHPGELNFIKDHRVETIVLTYDPLLSVSDLDYRFSRVPRI